MTLPSPRWGRGIAGAVGIALACGACDRVNRTPAHRRGRNGVDSTAPGRVATVADGFATGVSVSGARFVMNITSFRSPESVRYDPDQDVFFVSNMAGYGSARDNYGYISRVNAGDPSRSTVLVRGGASGAVLNAPKGIALHGDTLWVTDIDVLRGFNRYTGMPLATIDFRPQGAVQLNDVAVGPDGTLRVTDTGVILNAAGAVYVGHDRIYKVGPSATVSVVGAGPALRRPNGITWDPVGKRWIVVSFDPFVGEIATFTDGDSLRRVIRTGSGKLDGVEVLRPSGAIVFSSWADSSVHILENGRERKLIRQVPVPADIGIDTRRNRVAIPMTNIGWVQLWSLGDSISAGRH